MSDTEHAHAPDDLVDAAIRAAGRTGRDVADVPLIEIAREAGLSRSTLLRRLGGRRGPLDAAVRAAGVDPGGRPPVRDRAVDAVARLLDEVGLAATTMEAVASAADCSVHSLYAAFGSRDDLLAEVFERYSPLSGVEAFLADPGEDLAAAVRGVHLVLARAFLSGPRVFPALLSDVFARPTGPTRDLLAARFFPRALAALGGWMAAEVAAGRVRDLPLPLLVQQLVAPVVVHFALRPALTGVPGIGFPDVEETCAVFSDAFLRAAATDPPH
ncbi:DNA-binding transcriptional regulator, AcrR family [Nocardiopsis flavescens]|uniref:DNA-binding transcriptional regulator, AcrR family n=1 Tax=Nocardiopsis flavescens TaxID=758803 RepID=A0A1M6HKT9_9ACTN|nr:TetR/AcrR family transcriptional regulator [Nocardiopsis flavescens]SHJ22775.1 DNA-binding transcriptional regulator, AcrR family [Nocardiopsis flavescens]